MLYKSCTYLLTYTDAWVLTTVVVIIYVYAAVGWSVTRSCRDLIDSHNNHSHNHICIAVYIKEDERFECLMWNWLMCMCCIFRPPSDSCSAYILLLFCLSYSLFFYETPGAQASWAASTNQKYIGCCELDWAWYIWLMPTPAFTGVKKSDFYYDLIVDWHRLYVAVVNFISIWNLKQSLLITDSHELAMYHWLATCLSQFGPLTSENKWQRICNV